MIANGKLSPTEKTRDCAVDGHNWIQAHECAIVTRICHHCPAIGAPCPEHETFDGELIVDARRRCPRCRGTGTIELVEIALADVKRLRVIERRYEWLLGEFASNTHTRPADAIREIDELIELRAVPGGIGGGSTALTTGQTIAERAKAERASRAKKPSTSAS